MSVITAKPLTAVPLTARPLTAYALGVSTSGAAAFSPLELFAAGEQGAWYDPSDLSSMFQDSAGTVPVTADGDPVGKILDKSGRGNHAVQATTTKRPLYKTSGGLHWLLNDGVDDVLATAFNRTITEPASWNAALAHVTGAAILEGVFYTSTAANAAYSTASTGGIFQRSDGAQRGIYGSRRIINGTNYLASALSAFTIGAPYIAQAKTEVTPANKIKASTNTVSAETAATWTGTEGTNLGHVIFTGSASVAQMKFFGGVILMRAMTAEESAALESYLKAKNGTP